MNEDSHDLVLDNISNFSMPNRNCAPHTSPEQTKSKLGAVINSTTNGVLEFVMVHREPNKPSSDKGTVIGKVGIWSFEKQEIGYMLHRDYWRKGYMAEAMTAIIPLFWKKGMTNVVADVDPRNESSIKLLEKFGFVETGRESKTGDIDGVWYDSVYLGLEKPKDVDIE